MVQNQVGAETSAGHPGGNQDHRVGPRRQGRLVECDQAAANLGMNSVADGYKAAVRDEAHGPIGLGEQRARPA